MFNNILLEYGEPQRDAAKASTGTAATALLSMHHADDGEATVLKQLYDSHLCFVCGETFPSGKTGARNSTRQLPIQRGTATSPILQHCCQKHAMETIWHVLPDPPHSEKTSEHGAILDFLMGSALRFAADQIGIENLLSIKEWNDPSPTTMNTISRKCWVTKWIDLTTKRIGLAYFFVKSFDHEAMIKRFGASGGYSDIKKKAFDALVGLEATFKYHLINFLLQAMVGIGKARCINRYQLCFYEPIRYRFLLGHQEVSPSPNDFLLP